MNAARVLRWARRHALLSQRELAAKAGVPQSTIARIERGRADPRVGLLSRLLHACGFDLEAVPLFGQGVDRTHLRANLQLTPEERLALVTPMVRSLAGLRGALRQPRVPGQAPGQRAQAMQAVGLASAEPRKH